MSETYTTLSCLAALGFTPRSTLSGMDAVGYRFRLVDLVASASCTIAGVPQVRLNGTLDTWRTIAFIDYCIPPDLETAEAAAAWVSYQLKQHRSGLEPLPAWFLEGEKHWDQLPPVIEERRIREEMEAYQARPKCFVDRDYARPLRRKLRTAISGLAGETAMTVGFDGRVLSIALNGEVHEVLASGESWPSAYRVTVSENSRLPDRFKNPDIVISVFENQLSFDRYRLGPCEIAE
ncbi:MAG: hypothetical protein F4114_05635 [Rhodospirillaceae bacterium]|nr:hypothetical protein [Rhodospirillaceae bacterium]MYB14547.1 hypothetical protein [Rhodospirillaceae bacterium]MYI48554.1 hypothetical protein [Rhodospirillaceae bacterium]